MNKQELKELIEEFYDKWQNIDGLWRNDFFPSVTEGYTEYSIKISFGQGIRIVPPKNPWMAFLKYNQRVSKGIYPIITIENNLLYIYLGVSQENNPELDSNFITRLKEQIGTKEFTISDTDDLMNYLEDILNQFDSEMNKYINRTPVVLEPTNSTVKNIILYGSPGVGKTHNTKKLISLIESGKSDKEIFENIKNNEFTDVVDINDIKDRVKFITFHQSFGYEDFIEGFRPNDEGNIELEDGVFKNICDEARINFIRSIKYKSTLEYDERQEKLFELFIDEVENEIDKNEKYYINSTVYITSVEGDAFRYQGTNWKNSQRMKFDDIKLIWGHSGFTRKDIKNIPNISGLAIQHATYFAYLSSKLLEFSESQNIQISEIEKEEQKNFYLVIDEINRGNISKIFGELITLIEEDKRDTLEVTLPYSKKSFKIPSNLYIIGTMNSTDKSIALIDIALRRRFTFLKMKPNSDLVENVKAKNIMEQLNGKITETLGADYVLGHSYFMKIDSDDDLGFVLEYKIKPLLEEYFYGDEQGLKNILEIINESI